ncbi:MAG: DNA polymerase III subunit epsilon, partial [Pseudomonadota bacterium]
MREIVFDTETTGLDPKTGDRVVEIGCVELRDHFPTGNTYHQYINPERDMPDDAFRIHGLSTAFLSDKPVFADIAAAFLEFIDDAILIAHNANFDINFLNHELGNLDLPVLGQDRVVDTLALARRKHPGGSNSLDALCRRYGIDNSSRTLHGALLDSEILAEVYLEMIGGHQAALNLAASPLA